MMKDSDAARWRNYVVDSAKTMSKTDLRIVYSTTKGIMDRVKSPDPSL